jgi:hypothetical protein
MFPRLGLALLFSYAALMAQTNSVTVIASQSGGQPDSAAFAITVTSGFNATVEAVVNAVSSLGLTTTDLVGIGQPSAPFTPPLRPAPPQEQWTFQLIVPFPQMTSTTAALTALQKSFAAGLSLSWTVTGTQSAASATTCNLADLAAQASAQAQTIAAAASVKLGAIGGLAVYPCSLTASYALSTAPPGARTLIATVSQPLAAAAPDQVGISIQVGSLLNATLSGITAALTKAGIGGITLTGTMQNSLNLPLVWTFTETVPLANLAATLAQLTAAQRKIGGGLTLLFGPQGLSDSQAPACSETGLLSQAQSLAQNAAAATGASVGPLLSMSSGGGVALAARIPGVPLFSPPPATCSVTAQFQLL